MSLYRVAIIVALATSLAGCALTQRLGFAAPTVTTSNLPATVPYYLDPCGQPEANEAYRLFSPSALGRWRKNLEPEQASASDAGARKKIETERNNCLAQREIANGDPLSVTLNRVGLSGWAEYNDTGRCIRRCRPRDIAVVLDFNGSATLQKPIVAFYQRKVRPDGQLQFSNQVVFVQDEWFYRYPPNIRIRLYDVRDDKNAELRANLRTLGGATNALAQYINGATIAGPIVDTALKVADQLISRTGNDAIMDMSFQLFPPEPPQRVKSGQTQEEVAQAKRAETIAKQLENDRNAALTTAEVSALQRRLRLPVDGIFGPRTAAAVTRQLGKEPSPYKLRQLANLINDETTNSETRSNSDNTFRPRIYASQFIVFVEKGRQACDGKQSNDVPIDGRDLPRFYYMPDGVNFGGARVYEPRDPASHSAALADLCPKATPYVVFSLTKDNAAVAADVSKRIDELQTKFAAERGITQDIVTDLRQAASDADLAISIDRVENLQSVPALGKLLQKLAAVAPVAPAASSGAAATGSSEAAAKPEASSDQPRPSETMVRRAERLIYRFTWCDPADQDRNWLNRLYAVVKASRPRKDSDATPVPPENNATLVDKESGSVLKCPVPDDKQNDKTDKAATALSADSPTPSATTRQPMNPPRTLPARSVGTASGSRSCRSVKPYGLL